MKQLDGNEIKNVTGGIEPQQREEPLLPEPATAPDILIDYNPEHPPQ